MKHDSWANDSYTQEDDFMEQVEHDWQQSGNDAALSTPPRQRANGIASSSRTRADDIPPIHATTPIRTPRVPGMFQSARRVARVDPDESQATEDGTFDDIASAMRAGTSQAQDSIPNDTDAKSARESTSKSKAQLRNPSSFLRYVLLGSGVLLLAWIIMNIQNDSLPRWHSNPAPLVEKPWRASSASTDQLQSRIDTLENAVNKLWRSFGDVATEVKQQHKSVTEKFRAIEQRMVFNSTVQALERQISALHAEQAEFSALWMAEKQHWEQLLAHGSSAPANAANNALHPHSASSLRERIAELDRKINLAAIQSQHADRAASDAQAAVDALRVVVPDQLPVRYDTMTKQLQIDPMLYTELRRILGSTPNGSSTQPAPESWTSFLDANRGELETLFATAVKEHLQARITSGMLLDRESFLALLKRELTRAKTEMSTNFNENVHSLQTEILSKVRQQQEMYEQSGSWHKPSDTPSFLHENIRAKDEVSSMIHAALALYASDQIGRADYAQYSAGGRVLPSLTSATYEVPIESSRSLSKLQGILHSLVPLPNWNSQAPTRLRGRTPMVALHHDNAPGMCWPLAGTHGQLGIQLVRKILVEAITIEHIPAVLALDGIESAPRDFEAWGILESEQDRKKLAKWRSHHAKSEDWDEPTPVPPSSSHVFLGAFTYDVAGAPIQTFPVSSEGAQVALPIRVVQLNILSNHGLRDYTCLYRVRVHGQLAD
ncbi:hypothetical protein MYAM1_004016 [Malassezia yamatoensis]|uniref:SUN domain-containing protein n=1 Tax=Malassezia yamatoensis TaxID=253288 RepID=A0AAJ5YVD3_9BASI|nr:hypothetical protein MYAM1_004016 [Malassezia yamatoensis]